MTDKSIKRPDFLEYIPFCTTYIQSDIVKAIARYGTPTSAATASGEDSANYRKVWRTVLKKAAKDGFAPGHFDRGTAPGYDMQKVTIQRDSEGNIVQSWERQIPEKEEIISQILYEHEFKPAPKITQPKKTNLELLTLYTLTDYHLGLYSWSDETGDDWDTAIASEVLLNAIIDMSNKAPDSEIAILNLQGDFLHWDGLEAVTPTGKNVLDADTRFSRMIELSLDLTSWTIELLLKKHKKVRLIVCEGNHDLAGSAWLRKAMKKIWSKNKRVEVDDNEFPFYAYLHGETMLCWHHGHKVKNAALQKLFSSEPRFRQMWGKSQIAYIHSGHYHHSEVIGHEDGGAVVERHPTLAGRDAYATRGGFVARRRAHVITYDKKDGEVDRSTVLPRIKK